MLNRLLRSITDKNNVTGEIATGVDERLDMAMIVPAESIRGLPNAKIYTSYTKFANWMSTEFGFVPVIGDEKVTFVHRDTLFQDTEIKDLQDSTSDLEYNVNAGLVYSGVKVGYDKQDYDSVNGRDEFRFINEYTTGITLTDNVLELVSPYRADAYGMEFLAEKEVKIRLTATVIMIYSLLEHHLTEKIQACKGWIYNIRCHISFYHVQCHVFPKVYD